jgi:hypothetical protein
MLRPFCVRLRSSRVRLIFSCRKCRYFVCENRGEIAGPIGNLLNTMAVLFAAKAAFVGVLPFSRQRRVILLPFVRVGAMRPISSGGTAVERRAFQRSSALWPGVARHTAQRMACRTVAAESCGIMRAVSAADIEVP